MSSLKQNAKFKKKLTDENSVGCFSAKRFANNFIVNKAVCAVCSCSCVEYLLTIDNKFSIFGKNNTI
jgi:hypothetical protein